MNNFSKAVALLVTCMLLMATASCSSKAQPVVDDARLDELAQQFMAELRDDILPLREDPVGLYNSGVLVNSAEGAAGIEYLAQFFQLYRNDEDCKVTTAIFSTSPLVVNRVQFEGGAGFYFRYELDEEAIISVSGKHIDNIEISTNENTGRVKLILYQDKKEIASFSFLPID